MTLCCGAAPGRFGDARFFASSEKAARFVVAPASMPEPVPSEVEGLLHQTPLTIPAQPRTTKPSIGERGNANSLARAMPERLAIPAAWLGLSARRGASKARTDEPFGFAQGRLRHGWRSEEAAQQERSWKRSDERLRGITPSPEPGT